MMLIVIILWLLDGFLEPLHHPLKGRLIGLLKTHCSSCCCWLVVVSSIAIIATSISLWISIIIRTTIQEKQSVLGGKILSRRRRRHDAVCLFVCLFAIIDSETFKVSAFFLD
jgi:hypothetical protein